MPIKLDDTDIAILESLVKNGRKSFNQISREIKVSTPTVKARYDRLVSAGLIKAVTLDLDFGALETKTGKRLEKLKKNPVKNNDIKLGKGMAVKISCEYCKGPVGTKPSVLKFGSFERFFCCTSCRSLYKEKYGTKIRALE
jgi:Lrp/AsnC family leucine-responsive transcriptional regulator